MTETAKLITAIVGVGVAVCGVNGAGLYAMNGSINTLRAEAAADRAEAAADRRAHQAAMDTFRVEMRRLAERQAHVEGKLSLVIETPPRER